MDNIISGINVSGQVYTILDPNAIHESEFSAYSGAVDTSLSSKASQTTVDALNDVVTAHTADTSIHLTSGDIETIISSQTADFVTGEELSSYTYDKATIDSKIASGGTFDPTQYYNKTATDELLAEKLDASAYTPTDLSNYYNKQEVDGIVASAKTEIEGEIPSLSGYATEQWVLDKNYITGVDLSNYSTTEQMNGAISAATSGLQPTLSAGTGISISGNVISATGGSGVVTSIGFNYYSGISRFDLDYAKDNNFYKDEAFAIGDGLSVDENGGTPIISTTTKFWTGTKAEFDAITEKDNNTIYLVTN